MNRLVPLLLLVATAGLTSCVDFQRRTYRYTRVSHPPRKLAEHAHLDPLAHPQAPVPGSPDVAAPSTAPATAPADQTDPAIPSAQ